MNYFGTLALIVFGYMNLWYVVSLIQKRNDVADVAWGPGFALLAWTACLVSPETGDRGLLVAILVSIWGFRLAWHIHSRNRDKPEDYRYRAWRQNWGKWFFVRSYFQVFILQGFLLLIISTPIMIVNRYAGPDTGFWDVLGVAVWFVGFYFEVVGDAQLLRFVKDPANRGKLMTSGLWAYTRHPNYFGEVTLWWGLWLITVPVPLGWLGVIGPVVISLLILYVSGIPMLEKKMAEKPEFEHYKRTVSAFFPMPVRKKI
ncbi:MAG: hypothetical protein JPMHGGIA_02366 [Saprospiraceae bacterium]|nr:hypothetical protein [Saprospiraceae bacterium]